MPIKWTPENDQALLLKILETSLVNVNAKAISESWPAERCDAQGKPPTARAITERLVKIRSQSKANGNGHFQVSSGKAKEPRSAPITPRKVKKEPSVSTPSSKAASTSFTMQSITGPSDDGSPSSHSTIDDFSVPATPMSIATSGGKRKREFVKIEEGADTFYMETADGGFIESPSKKGCGDRMLANGYMNAAPRGSMYQAQYGGEEEEDGYERGV